jgi:hypothetical protein
MSGSVALKAKGTFHPFPEQDEAPQPSENKDAGQKSTLKKSLTGLGSESATSKKETTAEDDDKPVGGDGKQKESSVRYFDCMAGFCLALTIDMHSRNASHSSMYGCIGIAVYDSI